MSDTPDPADDSVIARLRRALDEVAAHPLPAGSADSAGSAGPAGSAGSVSAGSADSAGSAGSVSDTSTVGRRSGSPRAIGPWIGAAAATLVLVIGAAWALGRREPAAPNDAPLAPAPGTTSPVAVSPASLAPAAWFSLTSPDLVPQPAGELALGEGSGAAWIATDRSDAPRLLLLRVVEDDDRADSGTMPGPNGDVIARPQPDGSVWTFTAIGFDRAIADDLADQVVAGSGVPFVLPDPSVQLLAFATPSRERGHAQRYVGDAGWVDLEVHPYVDQFEAFADAVSVRNVTVTGAEGYAALRADGSALVIWPAANGAWGSLSIDAGLAARIDEIVAAVVPARPPT